MIEQGPLESREAIEPGAEDARPRQPASEFALKSSRAASSDAAFPIVAIGASAGGLSALKLFFDNVPPDSGVAFVVVVHLSPDHESHLELLLQPHVHMPVQQVTQTVPIERNCVYVIPPNANLDTIDTHLRLSELEKRRQERAPIDHFFRTLAATHDADAIGVVLTGTGSDGSMGLRWIKQGGGLTIVQDPTEAEFDGMPQSAIATGVADLILPLVKIPEAILNFTRTQPRVSVPAHENEADAETRQFLQQVLARIRARTGRNLGHYKRSTLLRRITRRMQFSHIREPRSYLDLLRTEADEVRALADDLLITVTSFFRDPEVFDALEKRTIPRLFEGKGPADCVRVWCVACATGEEAYSLGMLLLEEAERHPEPPIIQLFASDLHQASLDKAREGFYTGHIEADIRPERLERFFQKVDGGYRVRKQLRELVVFTPHNVLGDPPFSRLDLISCRNLLIYFQNELQAQLAELFHYALQPDGSLLLGTSEAIDGTDLFISEDKRRGLYVKRNVPAVEPRLPVFPLARSQLTGGRAPMDSGREPMGYAVLHQQLLEQHGPPSALVSPDDNVLHFYGRAGHYFEQPAGAATTSLFKLLREELRLELRLVLSAAREQQQPLATSPVCLDIDGGSTAVVIKVRTALEPEHEGFALLLFEEHALGAVVADPAGTEEIDSPQSDLAWAHQFEAEKRLQSLVEAYESTQEELKASNEELQSANEELRSTLEELETSKEELQSMNEELQTVNQENRHKVEELGQLSNDLQNLLSATDIATLFLDREQRILRFTPKVAQLFNVRTSDRGRPLSDLTHRLGYDFLPRDAATVLEQLVPVEREVQDQSGRWYLTRILPYRSAEGRIAGTVVTFVEITQRKQGEDALRQEKEFSEQIIEALPEPLLLLKPDLSVLSANAAFYEHFELAAPQVRGQKLHELAGGQWDMRELRTLLGEQLLEGDVINGYRLDHVFSELGRRVLLLNARRLDDPQLILLGIQDVTDLSAAEQTIRDSAERLTRMINIEGVGVLIFDDAGKAVGANDAFLHAFGYTRAELEAGALSRAQLTPPEYVELSQRELQRLQETGRIGPYEKEYLCRDGSRLWMVFAGAALGDGTVVEYCIDVSARKRAEQALRDSEVQLAAELASMQRLHELVTRLFVCPDLPTALNEVLSAAIQIAGGTMGHVQLLDPANGQLRLLAQQGFDAQFLELLPTLNNTEGTACGRALRSEVRVVVEDVEEEPAYAPFRAAIAAAGFRAVQSTPLLSRDGSHLGVLATHYREPHTPSQRELRLLDLYARQAADFIDRMRSEEVLRQSQVRLGEENRNKDEYLAMLGHELRNPLAAIRSATELLKVSAVNDLSLARAHSVLERQSGHMSRIIDGLLEVSRIVRGKVSLELETLDVREVLEGLLQDKADLVAKRGLTLETRFSDEQLWVRADEVRLVQVFDNLLSNAMKFTPAPGSITVSAEANEHSVVVRIRDTGVGMRSETLSRIFQAFHQETQDAARSVGGLGLGLALAKGLIELHQGAIQAWSDGPGTGAVFEVRLPRQSTGHALPQQYRAPKLECQRILLVEDNDDAAQMLCELLENRGHKVRRAPSGAVALEILRANPIDIILCDLGLPTMSGYELARVLRAERSLRHIPMIAVTGYSQPEDRRKSIEAGFNDHLVKPVTLQALDAVLTRFATRKKEANAS